MTRQGHSAEQPILRRGIPTRILLVLLAATALVSVAYLLGSGRDDPRSLASPSAGSRPGREDLEIPSSTIDERELTRVDPVPASTSAVQDGRRNVSLEPEVGSDDLGSLAEAASTEAQPVADEANLEATTSIRIRAVDPKGVPIEGVQIRIWAMRSQRNPATHYLYRGDTPTAVTDQLGIAVLDHWVWVDLDGKTGQVTLTANHEGFSPFTGDVEIGTEIRDIELQWGATVVVSAWYGVPSRVIPDIEIQVDRDAGLPATAWERDEEGALRTSRLSIGPHRIRVSHESAALGQLFSAVRDFQLGPGDWLVLDLELLPAARFEGVLDARVPRPIVDGHVMVCIQAEGPRNASPSLYREFETSVEADGPFVFEALPPGQVQLVALCEGWVSQGIDDSEARLTVPQWVAPHVVAMKRTGTIEVEVLDEKGSRIAGATVGASPNVRFVGVGSSTFPWRDWTAQTDEAGIATITDLPPTPALRVHAGSETHRMRKEDRERSPAIEVLSGQTSRITLRLEPKD